MSVVRVSERFYIKFLLESVADSIYWASWIDDLGKTVLFSLWNRVYGIVLLEYLLNRIL